MSRVTDEGEIEALEREHDALLAETARLRAERDQARAERDELKMKLTRGPARIQEAEATAREARHRCRRAGQTLIEAIGAPGPESVIVTAERACAEIARLRAERDDLLAVAEAASAVLGGVGTT